MARLYIGYDQLGPNVFKNVRKNQDRDPLIILNENSQEDLTLDFTGYLEANETVSSATITDTSNISVSSPTVSTPKVTVTLSNLNSYGYFKITVTMSSGAKKETKIIVREPVKSSNYQAGYCNCD